MPEATMTSRQANQDFSRVKRAAKDGPVIITERGRPTQVLMSYEEYQRLKGPTSNLLDLLSMPEMSDIEFEIGRDGDDRPRELDLD